MKFDENPLPQNQNSVTISELDPNPFKQFEYYYDQAVSHGLSEPNSMVVSTCLNQQPSCRYVLLRNIIDDQFIFFTNYNSEKGHHIESNPRVALLFWWPELYIQIRIEGTIEKTSAAVSEEYFNQRPLESRIASIISNQSHRVENKDSLLSAFNQLKNESKNNEDISRPDHWGGYAVTPKHFNILVLGKSRLHDSFNYDLTNDLQWSITRVAP